MVVGCILVNVLEFSSALGQLKNLIPNSKVWKHDILEEQPLWTQANAVLV